MKEEGLFNYNFENAERIGYLIASFIKGTLTPLERKELDAWILESEENEVLFDDLTNEENIEKTMQWYASIDEEKARERIKNKISFVPQRRRTISFSLIAIAASVILILSVGVIYLITQSNKLTVEQNKTVAISDPQPGKDKAILTLANGRKIVLDSTAPASVEDGKITIENSTVVYTVDASDMPSENLLTVPRGGQYKLVLPDGTKVWLNAESSLKYQTAFNGNERRVVLTGEAYFDVTKNKEKPFIVESSGNTIKVLGTRFNVNSYGDENVFVATLVEGSVQVTSGNLSKTLRPGEQAKIDGSAINVKQVDAGEFIAWKDGEFVFRDAPVHSITNQLARWYDLQVEFRDPVDKHLNATIKRDLPLSKILYYLEQTGDVHFKVEGKKLIVMK
jgi:ferric-dicitrate binding protein FerR (iron transport regulator)